MPRVDDRHILGGIVYLIRNGLQVKDAPKKYGSHETLYNCFIHWLYLSTFDSLFIALTEQARRSRQPIIDSAYYRGIQNGSVSAQKGLFSSISDAEKAG
ncbi:transposase and inactivated derivatives [Gluconobacter frateurii NBRC 103465]|nr:transposase and inactivated derivatives [Gluconobacter frateurii NBRC 103465]